MTDEEPTEEEPTGHAPRERVSWNANWLKYENVIKESRSTWACELKFQQYAEYDRCNGHAPRERVSWNNSEFPTTITIWVTLHVSVWVEICENYLR